MEYPSDKKIQQIHTIGIEENDFSKMSDLILEYGPAFWYDYKCWLLDNKDERNHLTYYSYIVIQYMKFYG